MSFTGSELVDVVLAVLGGGGAGLGGAWARLQRLRDRLTHLEARDDAERLERIEQRLDEQRKSLEEIARGLAHQSGRDAALHDLVGGAVREASAVRQLIESRGG